MSRYEIHQPGDRIDHGTRTTRYAMFGDTYMHSSMVGEMAEQLFRSAERIGKVDWLPQIAVRLRLAHSGVPISDAAMILAKAQVIWSDICTIKS